MFTSKTEWNKSHLKRQWRLWGYGVGRVAWFRVAIQLIGKREGQMQDHMAHQMSRRFIQGLIGSIVCGRY